MSLQVCFGASVMRSLSTASANPNIPMLLYQRVYHAVVRDARVHLLLQKQQNLIINNKSWPRFTLTATIAPSWSLWYFALCCANPDFDPLTFPQILHGQGIPFICVSVWRLRFACKTRTNQTRKTKVIKNVSLWFLHQRQFSHRQCRSTHSHSCQSLTPHWTGVKID